MSAPYYQDDLVTLYLGDCREIRDWLDADVLLTDPPYGVDYDTGARRDTLPTSIAGDKDTAARDDALTMWGQTRPALVFGSWRVERPAATKALLVWDTKGALGMGDLRIPWKPAHQEIYVLGDGPWKGKRSSDVLVCPPVQSTASNGRLHIHQKPIALLAELAEATTGVIADPFCGSGSTAVAARMLGRKCITVEVDEATAEIAAARLARETASGLDLGGAA
jgi:site-specific DNA-methyltransferase (adenine-specific)